MLGIELLSTRQKDKIIKVPNPKSTISRIKLPVQFMYKILKNYTFKSKGNTFEEFDFYKVHKEIMFEKKNYIKNLINSRHYLKKR